MIPLVALLVVMSVLGVTIYLTHQPRDGVVLSRETFNQLHRIDREHDALRARAARTPQ